MRDTISTILERLAVKVGRPSGPSPIPDDLDEETRETIKAVSGLTRTSPERVAAACEAIRYLSRCDVAGDIVECGVWRGGTVLAMLRTLQLHGDRTRDIYLYDTYEGMSEPTQDDKSPTGASATDLLAQADRSEPLSVWCNVSLEDVAANVATAGYDPSKIHFVRGLVEETIPATMPERIALLRLDTDWYESTKHELIHLYPRLVTGGVLILDDYGYWQGARKAVDEYVSEHRLPILLSRIDNTGRIAVKT